MLVADEEEYLLFLFLFLLFIECFLNLIWKDSGSTLTPSPTPIFVILGRVEVDLDPFQFSLYFCHYVQEMCRVLLMESLEHHFLFGFDYPRPSMIQIFQDLLKIFPGPKFFQLFPSLRLKLEEDDRLDSGTEALGLEVTNIRQTEIL